MNIDRNSLLEEAEPLTVAEHIGMEVQKRGSRYWIRCPGHEKRLGKTDNKIGNCVLTQRGYRCYACGVNVGMVDMVMEYTGCNYKEALNTIAESCGGADLFQQTGDVQKKVQLSREDLEMIGLSGNPNRSKNYVNTITTQPEQYKFDDAYLYEPMDDGYLVYEKTTVQNLQRLLNKDEAMYASLIAKKAKEASKIYQTAIDEFCNRDAKKAGFIYDTFSPSGKFGKQVFVGLMNAYQKKLCRCGEICAEYTSPNNKEGLK